MQLIVYVRYLPYMACAIAGITVISFNARIYLPLAKPNHLWVSLEYLTGSQEVVGSNPIFSIALSVIKDCDDIEDDRKNNFNNKKYIYLKPW